MRPCYPAGARAGNRGTARPTPLPRGSLGPTDLREFLARRRSAGMAEMATRLGIELSPAACRIVEIEAGPAFRRRQRDTRVCLVFGAPAVGSGDPGQAGVTAGAERRRDCLGREPRASPGDGDRPLPRVDARRPVVVALASATEVSAALQALRNAGIRLRTSRRRRSRWVRSRGCAARCRCRAQSRRTQGCAGAAEASSAEVVRASG